MVELTGVPAILGHRVVTLHPKIHGGILADPTLDDHRADMDAYGIEPIDLVVVNLYPFSSKPGIELIDIGGPAMVRAAAKNHAHVGVVVDPADYRARARRGPRRGRDHRRHQAAAGACGVRPYGGVRRGDRHLVRRHRSAGRRSRRSGRAPADDPPRARVGAAAAVRREPAPAGRPVPAGGQRELVGQHDAARRQGTQLPQRVRHRGGVATRPAVRRAGVCDRQARQPVWRCRGRRHHRGLRAGERLRPGQRLRRHRGAEPYGPGRPRGRAGRGVHRGDRRAGVRRRGARGPGREEEPARDLGGCARPLAVRHASRSMVVSSSSSPTW